MPSTRSPQRLRVLAVAGAVAAGLPLAACGAAPAGTDPAPVDCDGVTVVAKDGFTLPRPAGFQPDQSPDADSVLMYVDDAPVATLAASIEVSRFTPQAGLDRAAAEWSGEPYLRQVPGPSIDGEPSVAYTQDFVGGSDHRPATRRAYLTDHGGNRYHVQLQALVPDIDRLAPALQQVAACWKWT